MPNTRNKTFTAQKTRTSTAVSIKAILRAATLGVTVEIRITTPQITTRTQAFRVIILVVTLKTRLGIIPRTISILTIKIKMLITSQTHKVLVEITIRIIRIQITIPTIQARKTPVLTIRTQRIQIQTIQVTKMLVLQIHIRIHKMQMQTTTLIHLVITRVVALTKTIRICQKTTLTLRLKWNTTRVQKATTIVNRILVVVT